MTEPKIMTAADIHAFGVEIVCRQLETDGWTVEWADALADIETEPQIIAVSSNNEHAFFIVRTAVYPSRGRFEQGQAVFEKLIRYAAAHEASCYFASVGIANSEAKSDADMSVPVKGVAFHVDFNGLVKMELPPDGPHLSGASPP